jgi:hypothetical protein
MVFPSPTREMSIHYLDWTMHGPFLPRPFEFLPLDAIQLEVTHKESWS